MARILSFIAVLFFASRVFSKALDSDFLLDSEFLSEMKDVNNKCPTYNVVACSNNNNNIDKCCVPNQGHFVLALQWLPSYCKNAGGNKNCKKGTLKKVEQDTWTLHGLWPGFCDGETYETNCNPDRYEENIEGVIRSRDEDLLDEMERLWLSGNPDANKDNNWFWVHEWNKHGQCVSTITPECLGADYKMNDDIITYFEKALELRSIYDLYPVLERQNIVPNDEEGYDFNTLQNAFKTAFNNTQVQINCL